MYKLDVSKKLLIFYLFNDCMVYAEYHGTLSKDGESSNDQQNSGNFDMNNISWSSSMGSNNSDGKKSKNKKNKFLKFIPIDSAFSIQDYESYCILYVYVMYVHLYV